LKNAALSITVKNMTHINDSEYSVMVDITIFNVTLSGHYAECYFVDSRGASLVWFDFFKLEHLKRVNREKVFVVKNFFSSFEKINILKKKKFKFEKWSESNKKCNLQLC
jgi:hypothetical protein